MEIPWFRPTPGQHISLYTVVNLAVRSFFKALRRIADRHMYCPITSDPPYLGCELTLDRMLRYCVAGTATRCRLTR